jgi:hypothetical protein
MAHMKVELTSPQAMTRIVLFLSNNNVNYGPIVQQIGEVTWSSTEKWS